VATYACFSWPHHIHLGFQEQALNMDETITTSLVTLIKNLLTFQSKTWYNTMLTFDVLKRTSMLNCVRDGKNLFQVRCCNFQTVITFLTYLRHHRGQLLQGILSSYWNKSSISVK
jgi:capsid protein